VEKKLQKKLAVAQLPSRTKAQRKVMLFSHLHQYERELSVSRSLPVLGGPIPAVVLQLGIRYAEGTISGSNARCVALLQVMQKVSTFLLHFLLLAAVLTTPYTNIQTAWL
jgi:translation initiation factor eIF-2B subunit delta